MMFKRRNADPHAAAEAEIVRLSQRREELASRLRAAEDDASAAAKARRDELIEADDFAGPALPALDARCAETASHRDALADAYSALQARLADAEQALAADRDKAEREAAAKQLDERVKRLDAAARHVAETAESLAAAHRAYTEMVEKEGVRSEVFPGFTRSPADVAFGVLADALATSLAVAVARAHPEAPPPRSAEEGCRELLTARMRALAAALRRGDGDLADAQPVPTAPSIRVAPAPVVEVALKEAIE